MPASTYSHYQDPETGQTILLPQLFPFATNIGEISSAEMDSWLSSGIIPTELYEADMQAMQRMRELRDRLQNGEQIPISELPAQPWALTEYLLKNRARLYGENVLKKIFSRLSDDDPDIVWLSFIKEALTIIATEDPATIHFYTARTTLKEEFAIEDSKAIDILARELVEQCRILQNFKAFQHPAFKKNPIDLRDLHDHLKHEKRGMLQLDADFVDYLRITGSKGKKLSADVEKNSKELFEFYENNNYNSSIRRKLWGLWITDSNPLNLVLHLLAQVLWEDRCVNLWNRKTTGHPAIAKPIIDKLIPILGPQQSKQFTEKEGQVICYDRRGEPLLMAPAVDVNMIEAFKKGIKEFSSLTGHKVIRWQVNTGFERWAQGAKDPRLIEIDGGFSRIAELTKCTSKTDISKIKEILHAQAFGYFIFPDGSQGNMIILRIEDKHKNGEPSKIRIVLGDMLLPGYVCQLQRSEKRLIPIGDLPPLHGSFNTHASQAQLQLLVFAEFSNQSKRLAQEGSVLIPIEKWKQMAHEAGLNPNKIELIIEYWSQPDFFNCFLDRQGDEYRLASHYERAQRFLEIQGENRLVNSKRGKRSVEKQKEKKKRA